MFIPTKKFPADSWASGGGKHQFELACHKQLYWTNVLLSLEITSPEAQTESDGEQWQNHSNAQVPKLEHQLPVGLIRAMNPPRQPYYSYSYERQSVTLSHACTSWMRLFEYVGMVVNFKYSSHKK